MKGNCKRMTAKVDAVTLKIYHNHKVTLKLKFKDKRDNSENYF